jgi:flagellar motor component MotA
VNKNESNDIITEIHSVRAKWRKKESDVEECIEVIVRCNKLKKDKSIKKKDKKAGKERKENFSKKKVKKITDRERSGKIKKGMSSGI